MRITLLLVIVPLVIASLVWLWRDANRHGQPGALWAGLTLVLGYPLGLVIWLFERLFLKSKSSADTQLTTSH